MSSDLQRKARLRQHQQTCADSPAEMVGSALVCGCSAQPMRLTPPSALTEAARLADSNEISLTCKICAEAVAQVPVG